MLNLATSLYLDTEQEHKAMVASLSPQKSISEFKKFL